MSEDSGDMNDRNGTNLVKYTSLRATADVFTPTARKSNVLESAARTITSHHLHLRIAPRPPHAGYIRKPMSSSAPPKSLLPIEIETRKYDPNRNARCGRRNKAERHRLFGRHVGYGKEPPTVQRLPSVPEVRSYPDLDGMLRGISPPNFKDAEPFREQLEIITRQVAIMGRYSQLEFARRASNMVDALPIGRQGLRGTGTVQAQNVHPP
jgi:hypothetical protein